MLNDRQRNFCALLARALLPPEQPVLLKGGYWARSSGISRPLKDVGSGTGMSHVFGTSPISTVPYGVSGRFAGGAPARAALVSQAMRNVTSGKWSPKQARERLSTSTQRVRATVNTVAPAAAPIGFGGSGNTGSVPKLGAPQTGGYQNLAAPWAPPVSTPPTL